MEEAINKIMIDIEGIFDVLTELEYSPEQIAWIMHFKFDTDYVIISKRSLERFIADDWDIFYLSLITGEAKQLMTQDKALRVFLTSKHYAVAIGKL